MDVRETGIALLWDSAPLWSLLVWRALREMGVACAPLKPLEIAQGGLSDKRLLLVPGGSARQKYAALGEKGRKAVRDFAARGGFYLGFCGGAGLGLTGEDGLGLCPWRRAEFQDRLPHLLSGHVPVQFTEHAFAPSLFLPHFRIPQFDETAAALPVWWPGRFQPADATGDAVQVLASYHLPPGDEQFPPDMMVADLPLSRIPREVLENWREQGVELPPDLHGAPCVVQGPFGKGAYVLSYSHLETPDSPMANRWLASFIEGMGHVELSLNRVPQWDPLAETHWNDAILLAARDGMSALLQLAQDHGLMFPRTSWLVGWRAGTPGSALNTLYLVLCTLAASRASGVIREMWLAVCKPFEALFWGFIYDAEWCLLTQRLAGTLSATENGGRLAERVRETRLALFGTAMRGGGVYQKLLDLLNPILFEVVKKGVTRA